MDSFGLDEESRMTDTEQRGDPRGAQPADFFVRVDSEAIKTAGSPGAVTGG